MSTELSAHTRRRWRRAEALAELLPKVTVLTLPGQGHGAFWVSPEPVAEQIRQFLLS
jgi:pimeloyl-ACP methyl ester carboxylesterase